MLSTPADFVQKWEAVTLPERATVQEHFVDLCRLLGVHTPVEADPTGQWYRFEQPLTKAGGGAGFADVWRRDHFAWEYKGKGRYRTLDEAYKQLLLYRDDLGNPPVLVVCDIAHFELHIAFTGHKTRIERFTNADLLHANTRDLLRLVFTEPQQLCPAEKITTITERIAADVAQVAQWLEQRDHDPQSVAHFMMKLVFAMFAEDIGLLPDHLLSQSIRAAIFNPAEFNERIRALFRVMRDGGYWGVARVPRFNGGLFDDDTAIPLTTDELMLLDRAVQQNWQDVEPAIFGTLFERSLNPAKRAQLGAHYTGRDDMLLLVEPVVMTPLRRGWDAARDAALHHLATAEHATGATAKRARLAAAAEVYAFLERLQRTTVLDAACGSGNFLYVALHQLLDLEQAVINWTVGVGLAEPERGVGPRQVMGIEINPFAAELAQAVVWIGFLQWRRAHGLWQQSEPILPTLDTIQCADALLTWQIDGTAVETPWPTASVIVGNPPFLGDKKMRGELGSAYVEMLRKVYDKRVPGGADLVTYWFERARAQIASGAAERAGLLATQSIRKGANQKVLEQIKTTGDIFYAWADRSWILEGAAVRIAMAGFDDGSEQQRVLDGQQVTAINADLTGGVDVTQAKPLKENEGICFLGVMKAGPFDIDGEIARSMLTAPVNANGRPNSDVVKQRLGGQDVVRHPRDAWIIDFGVDATEDQATAYELPFAYVRTHVKPVRDTNTHAGWRTKWWLHGAPRPALRRAIRDLKRCIVTPEVAKHRIFVWMDTSIIPDHKLHVFARDDDYFFGVLQSRFHELWSLAQCSWLGVGNDPSYSSTRTFETFPFPWRPGNEPKDNPQVGEIAAAARALVEQRQAAQAPTLTALYNARPDWLAAAHAQLDAAVAAAYHWPAELTDDEVLARLLALNDARRRTTDAE